MDDYRRWDFCPRCGVRFKHSSIIACRDCRAKEQEWIHNRPQPGCTIPEEIMFFVTLHVGFISIIESMEELARLCHEKRVAPSGPSTPGIGRTLNKPRPIDRTAQRVTGFKD